MSIKRLTGDGSIIARVDSIANTNVWAKGGVMIRETLDWGSRHASVFVTPGRAWPSSGVCPATMPARARQAGIVAPRWVKLTRTGNLFTAQHSADGVTWDDVASDQPTSDTVVMGGTIYIGLALTSHAANVPCTAEFSGITDHRQCHRLLADRRRSASIIRATRRRRSTSRSRIARASRRR